MRWDPVQYARYADERGRPFLDLLAQVHHEAPRRVVDLGCGPGNLTALLSRRWPAAAVEGVDWSPEMIAKAAALECDVTFRVGDVTTWVMPDDTDVIISNATLQWVPGHQDLLRSWASKLPVGGSLAFQVPGNFTSPSHRAMRELAESPRWSPLLGGALRHHDAVWDASEYATALMSVGLAVDAWETTYVHQLQGSDPVVDWVKGTGLRPVLALLSDEDGAEFVAEYAAAMRAAYPADEHGTLFPFRRVFVVARHD